MMPENYEYYGGDSPRQDAKAAEMWRYALNAVDPDIDFSKYDWNGDGQVEQVFFIYAGLGQANGGDENTIWPHKSAVVNAMGTDYLYLIMCVCITMRAAVSCSPFPDIMKAITMLLRKPR